MKKFLTIISIFLFIFIFSSCNSGINITTITTSENNVEKEDITIIYTNDIHGYIANTKKIDGNEVEEIRLNNISGYVKKLKKENKNVLLVDAGDEIQGSIYGALDKGIEMIKIMNKTGFDLATPGNHDFDFGMDGFNRLVNDANYPFISCNFKNKENKNVLDSYKIFEIGGAKIGFVGVTTPETLTTSTPRYFQNDKGEFIYSFDGVKAKEDLYNSVQNAINEIRNKVDYLICLGHLGVGLDEMNLGVSSIDVIKNTTGIDAFIDGHSHTAMESNILKTKDSKDCILTQTGSYLNTVGVLNISKDGKITTKLIDSIEETDSEVKVLEDSLIKGISNELNEKIAVLDNSLYINNPDVSGQRLIRARETNLANLVSDSMYWYLNDYKNLGCDLAIVNGGGIRADVEKGDLTYISAKNVEPFGNQVCIIKTKGINIKNAIEMGANTFEKWDDEWNCPSENGGFIHAAGLKYDLDASIPSSVKVDENGMFLAVTGEYRTKNIKIYNKETNTYEPLDDNKEYLVGGINYILKNSGNGLSMFKDSENVLDYIEEDYTILAEYIKAFKKESDSFPHVNNNNAPLKKYNNYLYDYEKSSGSGRITLLNM